MEPAVAYYREYHWLFWAEPVFVLTGYALVVALAMVRRDARLHRTGRNVVLGGIALAALATLASAASGLAAAVANVDPAQRATLLTASISEGLFGMARWLVVGPTVAAASLLVARRLGAAR